MNEKILIIDDEQVVHVVLEHMLKDRFDVIHANSAQEGIDLLSGERVDLVLSDIHMPGMSGIEFLESLQLDAKHSKIPFLIITGQPSTEKEEKALNLGAVDFIDKLQITSNPEEVVDRIGMKLLSNYDQEDLDEPVPLNVKKLGKQLISESIKGDFFSTSRFVCSELTKCFQFDYISLWTTVEGNVNLIMSLGEVQKTSYSPKDLKQEATYRDVLQSREPYMYNHIAKDKVGIMADFSKENKMPAEIGIPLFAIDEKGFLKNNHTIPPDTPIFGIVFMKRSKLFTTDEFNLIRKIFIQAGTIFWRLYRDI